MRVARLSLRWRVAIAFGLGSLVITGVLAILTWDLTSGYMLRQRETGATAQAQVNVRLVDGALRTDPGGLTDLLKGLATDSDTTVLLDRPGGWLTSGRQIEPDALPRPLLDSAREGVPAHQRLVVDRGAGAGRGVAGQLHRRLRAAVPADPTRPGRSASSARC